MKILDGKNLSAKIKDELKSDIDCYVKKPVLAVITIGNDESSKIYVNNKKLASEYVGISFIHTIFEENEKEETIINKIKDFNEDKNINGIILQLPIPKKYNKDKIINTILPSKDVDGLTRQSMSKLILGEKTFIPCTTRGIMEMIKYYDISLEGKNVTIIGRSNLVGKPTFLSCLKENATVTVCHSKTNDLTNHTKQADIIISCTGQKDLINKDMIKKDVIIIDVGITRINGKIYGDVNNNVESKVSYLTPVPGGVGPMTVVMLLKNTFDAYKLQNGIKNE